jgi:hypothetical protein
MQSNSYHHVELPVRLDRQGQYGRMRGESTSGNNNFDMATVVFHLLHSDTSNDASQDAGSEQDGEDMPSSRAMQGTDGDISEVAGGLFNETVE